MLAGVLIDNIPLFLLSNVVLAVLSYRSGILWKALAWILMHVLAALLMLLHTVITGSNAVLGVLPLVFGAPISAVIYLIALVVLYILDLRRLLPQLGNERR